MAKQLQRHSTGSGHVHREGEGVLVDIQFGAVASVSGKSVGSVLANLGSVPVPQKRYSADICFVGYSHETVAILFGQTKYGTEKLRNLLVVKMTAVNVRRLVESTDSISDPSLAEIAQRLKLVPETLPDFDSEPEESVSLNASIALTGITGREGCMDFYHVSPFSITAAAKSRKLALDPVVRVDLRATLVFGLIAELRSLLAGLPKEVVVDGGGDNE